MRRLRSPLPACRLERRIPWHRNRSSVMRFLSRTLLAGLTILLGVSTGRADDWPQWLGPQRDSVWRETGILDKFPAGGPKVRWRTPIGGGYAGPAVAKG